MKKMLSLAVALLFIVLTPSAAQTIAPPPNTPAPITSTLNFNVGAGALGLGGASEATPASDVTLMLGLGLKAAPGLSLRSDNLLAPGANLQFYGGGFDYKLPYKFPASSVLSPLTFDVNGTFGLDRIVPATGPSQAHFGLMAGGSVHWTTSAGMDVELFGIDFVRTPGAPWGANAPAFEGSVSYFFGSH